MFKDHKKNLVYFFILILSFLLVFTQTQFLKPFKFIVIGWTTNISRVLRIPLFELKKILYYHRTFEEYKRLREETAVLKARLIGQEEVIRENTRLEELLKLKRKLIYSSIVANVIGQNPSFWNAAVIIDKGEEDGIKEGQPVVNASGVVGKIVETGRKTAKVILLTDPQFSVPALIQQSREVGLVTGTLQGFCRIRYLNPEASVSVGDKVITSKLSSSFPESLLVGEVIQVIHDPNEQSLECILQPAVSLSQLEEVLVILK